MARGGGSVIGWMCLFIPLQIYKMFRRNRLEDQELSQKESKEFWVE